MPSDSSAEDLLFDYLDPEEGRIYNDLARRIRSVSEELESEKTKQCDRRIAKPLTNLMQESYKEPPGLKEPVPCLYRGVGPVTRHSSR